MTMLAMAERLARAAHAGQRDLVGDYHLHLERVVGLVEGDEAKAVAWLHDILEDTPTTSLDLLAAGIPETVVDAVRVLTRHRSANYHTDYRNYIKTVAEEGNRFALAVKIADLKDHLRPLDPPVLKPERRRQYERSLRKLERIVR
jgi:(p)ppGpp synthase/HD superfamily hydrolase